MATTRHADCDPVFMVGHECGQTTFNHLRKLGKKLDRDNAFTVERLRYLCALPPSVTTADCRDG